VNAARLAAVTLLATSPAIPGSVPAYGTGSGGSVPLRATLRPAAPGPAPAWLEETVCDRGAELGPACLEVARAVSEEARAAGLDPLLMLAVIEVESGWDPHARSDRDAHGLMQLQPPTLADEAADGQLPSTNAHDPLVNVRAGIRYFGRMVERFGDTELALVAYNAGPNRLAAYLRAERGVPDRFWEYPRLVRRAERRIHARLARPGQLVAVAGAAVAAE
jgi:soluble lytic murein transglycosylase-like protein